MPERVVNFGGKSGYCFSWDDDDDSTTVPLDALPTSPGGVAGVGDNTMWRTSSQNNVGSGSSRASASTRLGTPDIAVHVVPTEPAPEGDPAMEVATDLALLSVANYDYDGSTDSSLLSLPIGCSVVVTAVDGLWLFGHRINADGNELKGYFPADAVTLL